jgi:rhodanese-related sulfurtransferase
LAWNFEPEKRFITDAMQKQASIPLKQALWQVPALIGLAFVLTIGANHWRADGIPLVGDWSVEARFSDAAGKSLVIALKQAGRLFQQNAALFVDARSADLYAQGHISGALSLPWPGVERSFDQIADKLDVGKPIIAYCDGETCELSHELALFLQQLGFENVHVLVNGWSAWQQAGLPTETGEASHEAG